jgi:hypothetical protein
LTLAKHKQSKIFENVAYAVSCCDEGVPAEAVSKKCADLLLKGAYSDMQVASSACVVELFSCPPATTAKVRLQFHTSQLELTLKLLSHYTQKMTELGHATDAVRLKTQVIKYFDEILFPVLFDNIFKDLDVQVLAAKSMVPQAYESTIAVKPKEDVTQMCNNEVLFEYVVFLSCFCCCLRSLSIVLVVASNNKHVAAEAKFKEFAEAASSIDTALPVCGQCLSELRTISATVPNLFCERLGAVT